MNQLTRMQRHANENTASSSAAIGYARKLAAQGKTSSQIGIMVRAAGYRITPEDISKIWADYRAHVADFRRAMEAGE